MLKALPRKRTCNLIIIVRKTVSDGVIIMVSDNEIVEGCLRILNQVRVHPHNISERCFLTAYQIWLLLVGEQNPLCDILVNEYGSAVGKGGGDNVGPAQRIAQALGRSSLIETHYLDTREIAFHGEEIFNASGEDCGLFRLRN